MPHLSEHGEAEPVLQLGTSWNQGTEKIFLRSDSTNKSLLSGTTTSPSTSVRKKHIGEMAEDGQGSRSTVVEVPPLPLPEELVDYQSALPPFFQDNTEEHEGLGLEGEEDGVGNRAVELDAGHGAGEEGLVRGDVGRGKVFEMEGEVGILDEEGSEDVEEMEVEMPVEAELDGGCEIGSSGDKSDVVEEEKQLVEEEEEAEGGGEVEKEAVAEDQPKHDLPSETEIPGSLGIGAKSEPIEQEQEQELHELPATTQEAKELQPESQGEPEPELQPESQPESQPEPQPDSKPDSEPEPQPGSLPEQLPLPQTRPEEPKPINTNPHPKLHSIRRKPIEPKAVTPVVREASP